MTEQNKKTGAVFCGVLICGIMQYYGYGHYYDVGPDFFKILDILPVFIACLYGLVLGLLCIVPAAISEIVWTMQLATPGPMVNLASFLITGIVVGILARKIDPHQIWLRLALMEAGLILMRFLMCLFRMCFAMKAVSLTYLILSLPNVIFIGLLLLIVAGRNWIRCHAS